LIVRFLINLFYQELIKFLPLFFVLLRVLFQLLFYFFSLLVFFMQFFSSNHGWTTIILDLSFFLLYFLRVVKVILLHDFYQSSCYSSVFLNKINFLGLLCGLNLIAHFLRLHNLLLHIGLLLDILHAHSRRIYIHLQVLRLLYWITLLLKRTIIFDLILFSMSCECRIPYILLGNLTLTQLKQVFIFIFKILFLLLFGLLPLFV